MPCYGPLTAYRSREVGASGKRKLVFNPTAGFRDLAVQVPCGQCIGCRLDKSRRWAQRIVHETKSHSENSFLTLTYDEEHLPYGHTLVKEHLQLFIKRLRSRLEPRRIRYYAVGEYGDKTSRPHYHAIIFGFSPTDVVLHSERDDTKLYRSAFLDEVWGAGHVMVGDVTFASAAYVARYCLKKQTGPKAIRKGFACETGEVIDRQIEFPLMSRRPGIGRAWIEKNLAETYRDDNVVIEGRKMQPAPYYDKVLEKSDPKKISVIKLDRQKRVAKIRDTGELSSDRMDVKEQCKIASSKLLKRNLGD